MTEHLTHLLMLGAPLAVFAVVFWLEWRRTSVVRVPPLLALAALAGAGSGVLHATVVGHHAQEAAVLGWFFAGTCVLQVSQAYLLLLAPVRRVVVAGVLGNLGLLALWAWTRSAALPFGIAGGTRQAVHPVDVACTGLELVVVLAGLAWVYGTTVVSVPVPASKWLTSTVRNSPPPRNTSSPSGDRPSHDTHSLRPSKLTTLATRS